MKKTAAIAAMAVVTTGGVLAFLALNDLGDTPKVRPEAALPVGESRENAPASAEAPEQAAAAKMQELNSASDRIEHLRWISRQDWARSNSPVLRTTIVSDPDESVQLEAVETALELARGEGAGATSSVVRTALASTKGNTRARGLKAAREHPDPALVSELIGLVDNGDPYAAMALSALAHADSADAREKVFAVAQDADTEPKLRERAVALLAVTKEREARPLLIELANGENESLARIAQEVLNVINEG